MAPMRNCHHALVPSVVYTACIWLFTNMDTKEPRTNPRTTVKVPLWWFAIKDFMAFDVPSKPARTPIKRTRVKRSPGTRRAESWKIEG